MILVQLLKRQLERMNSHAQLVALRLALVVAEAKVVAGEKKRRLGQVNSRAWMVLVLHWLHHANSHAL